MIIESTGEIEYLPISLWFEDGNHYHAFVENDDEPVADVRNINTQMNQVLSEEMDDEDFGMPGLPSALNRKPISAEIQSRPISRDINYLKEEGKIDNMISEELKEDILIAGGDFADFADQDQWTLAP